jgi:hypothetical protein
MQMLLLSLDFNEDYFNELSYNSQNILIQQSNILKKKMSSLLISEENDFEVKYADVFNEFKNCMILIGLSIENEPDPNHIFSIFEKMFQKSQDQIEDTIKNWEKIEKDIINAASKTLSVWIQKITDRNIILTQSFNSIFDDYIHISLCILSLVNAKRYDDIYSKNIERLFDICKRHTNEMDNILKVMTVVNEIGKIIKESDTYLDKNKLYENENLRQYPQSIYLKSLEELEENNYIMYDKDGSIIWVAVDNKKIAETLRQSTKLL